MALKTKADLEAERAELQRQHDEREQAAAAARTTHEATVLARTEAVAAARRQLEEAEAALAEATASPPVDPDHTDLDEQIAELGTVIDRYDQFMRRIQR